MNQLLYSLSGAQFVAALVQAALAGGKLRLFKSTLAPTPSTPLADFVTDEADFTGYPAGGTTIAAWLAPILSSVSGYEINSPLVQFATGSPTTVGNVIGGWFYVDTGGALVCYGTFGTPQAMQVPGAGLDITAKLVFPTGG